MTSDECKSKIIQALLSSEEIPLRAGLSLPDGLPHPIALDVKSWKRAKKFKVNDSEVLDEAGISNPNGDEPFWGGAIRYKEVTYPCWFRRFYCIDEDREAYVLTSEDDTEFFLIAFNAD